MSSYFSWKSKKRPISQPSLPSDSRFKTVIQGHTCNCSHLIRTYYIYGLLLFFIIFKKRIAFCIWLVGSFPVYTSTPSPKRHRFLHDKTRRWTLTMWNAGNTGCNALIYKSLPFVLNKLLKAPNVTTNSKWRQWWGHISRALSERPCAEQPHVGDTGRWLATDAQLLRRTPLVRARPSLGSRFLVSVHSLCVVQRAAEELGIPTSKLVVDFTTADIFTRSNRFIRRPKKRIEHIFGLTGRLASYYWI